MMRSSTAVLVALLTSAAVAQFPLHRSLEVSPGQQRPSITGIVQDTLGLLWAGSDLGILRTDGEQVDVILRTEDVHVNAIAAHKDGVIAALADGTVVRCGRDRCDTLLVDAKLAEHPVRSILLAAEGRVHLATYGDGLWTLHEGKVEHLNMASGLLDDHVNGLAALPDGRIVAATDQGLAVCGHGRVVEVFDGMKGAPDNLILSVAVDENGSVYAGTDGRGVFAWRPGTNVATLVDPAWDRGPVVSIAVHAGMVWAGTDHHGVALLGLAENANYRQHFGSGETARRCLGFFPDHEGAMWWCDGSALIHRADPAVLFVPEHEGADLRSITALCVDQDDRIWFATEKGLYRHSTAFSEDAHVTRIPLEVDPRTPIVSLAASMDGTVWAATFGAGVFAIQRDGNVRRYVKADGLGNDNVLAVRTRGDTVWFATLEGVSRWSRGRFQWLKGTAGFTFDVLPLGGDHALVATDGRGVLQWNGAVEPVASSARTYYSLVSDEKGGVWTCGPATGLCSVGQRSLSCVGAGRSPFDGDLFALGWSDGHAIAFGRTGTVALDPQSGRWTDLTARLGLEDIQAQLNVIARDKHGALWFGCDRGLVRLKLDDQHFQPDVPVIVTGLQVNGSPVGIEPLIRTTHDRNDITVRFTGLYYADPTALRFEYRVDQGRSVRTRDRELALPGLAPGQHTVRIRAFVGEPGPSSPWRTITIAVAAPWWSRVEVLVALGLFIGGVVYLLVRARDRRLRERERAEQEKVRFQLEALRSQVDPHFLFNSFNTLVALIETDTEKAVEHVDALSIFFRNMLVVRDKDLIPLHEELELLKSYFGLEQRRFGNAIGLFINLGGDVSRYSIVPLTLQLLVENALKHNAATVAQPLHVHVNVEVEMLVVRNTVRPRASAPRSTGFGLESIIKRYAALTPRPVEVVRGTDTFTVRIPLIAPDEHPDR